MKGHLHITCARRDDGSGVPPGPNYLRRQSFRAPLHLSKAHEDEGALVVNMVSPTAGVFDDDEIDIRVEVEPGASLLLTTPGSSRIYRSRRGGYGAVQQLFNVAPGGFLEFYPEPFIPHAGARYRQRNTLRVAEGGTLLFFEWLTPGRVAAGEAFEYEELQWDTDLWLGERLLARECYTLSPHDNSLRSVRLVYNHAHYIACYVLGNFAFPQSAIEALCTDNVYLGCGPLFGGGWTIKALCADSLCARATMKALRAFLYKALGRNRPNLGRF